MEPFLLIVIRTQFRDYKLSSNGFDILNCLFNKWILIRGIGTLINNNSPIHYFLIHYLDYETVESQLTEMIVICQEAKRF